MQIVEEFKRLYCLRKNILIKNYVQNDESIEYCASSFYLNHEFVHFRCAKITPTKIGQFVTFWKRNALKITEPYDTDDVFDHLIVYVKNETQNGFFLFPKQVLIEHDIVSKNKVGGKRGFRVYPSWDKAENKQAKKTQNWQLQYFVELVKNL